MFPRHYFIFLFVKKFSFIHFLFASIFIFVSYSEIKPI